jgi:hypothetical protein
VLIAVSDGPSLFGSFDLYAIDTTDDGNNGTPLDPGSRFSLPISESAFVGQY